MTGIAARADDAARVGGGPVLLTIAPAVAVAADLPVLLRVAIDAEQVGAARLHLPAGLPDPGPTVDALRSQTGLVLTADDGDPVADLCDRPGPGFSEVVLAAAAAAELVATVAGLAAESLAAARVISVAGLGSAAIPVQLAAVAAGLHVRVGTADTVSDGPGRAEPASTREDIALIARAAGLARIAGRPLARGADALRLLGLA